MVENKHVRKTYKDLFVKYKMHRVKYKYVQINGGNVDNFDGCNHNSKDEFSREKKPNWSSMFFCRRGLKYINLPFFSIEQVPYQIIG